MTSFDVTSLFTYVCAGWIYHQSSSPLCFLHEQRIHTA